MSEAPLMLSVSGMRGLVGRSLTPATVAEFAAAWGLEVRRELGVDRPRIVLGRDSRPSGHAVEAAAAAGLLAAGCDVVNLGLAATPTVAVMVDHLQAHGGMVATASHNPIAWNGLKPITHQALAPPPDLARRLVDRFQRRELDYADPERCGHAETNDAGAAVHVRRVLERIDADAIAARRPRIVVDSVNGAGGQAARLLCDQLGADLVHINDAPTGLFAHTPEPTRENLTGLCDAVAQHRADLGFAQDPDADRLAIVDQRGRYIGEEYSLALCAQQVFRRQGPGPAVANLSTSRMIDHVAADAGAVVHRCPVGEANVAAMMKRLHAVVGGEGNGGVIWPPVAFVRDSVATMALVLELMAQTGSDLAALADALPAYAIVKDKLPIQPGMADHAVEALADAFHNARIDRQDGIRVDTDDGWLHLRPSNTEPILRIIAEAPDEDHARALIAAARRCIND